MGATPTFSCIEDWSDGGEGNTNLAPQFVDANGPDGNPDTHEDSDYHLLPDSPCIDAGANVTGLPETDFDGNPRPVDGDGDGSADVDMGAFEFQRPHGPPIGDAGENIQILSTEQLRTVVLGSGADPDGAPLEYRWLEGEDILLAWSPVGPNGGAYLNLATLPYLTLGNHTLKLEVREIKEGGLSASDEMILTVDNSPPCAQPNPSSQTVEIGIDPIVVVADVSDFDGDLLSYEWLKEGEVLGSGSIDTPQGGATVQIPDLIVHAGDARFPPGDHSTKLKVDDGVKDPVSASVCVNVIDTSAPSLTPIPSVTILWPPNHELQPVTIQANAFDNGGGTIHLDVYVVSSQPPDSTGDCNMIPDYYTDSVNDETGVIGLRLRSERPGTGDGRKYTITIVATDESGKWSVAAVEILAPHDKRKK